MPLIPDHRREFARSVELPRQFQHLRPALFRNRETVDPLVLDVPVEVPDVVPVRVRSKREKIQMIPRDLERPPQRPLRIAHVAMIMQITEVDVEIIGSSLWKSDRRSSRAGE